MPVYILKHIITPLDETTMEQKLSWIKFWENATNQETKYLIKLQDQLALLK